MCCGFFVAVAEESWVGRSAAVRICEPLTFTYRSYRLTDMVASVDTVLDALGDRTRRIILEKLSSGPVAVGVLADQLPVSRPAVSQHLRVLKGAELVVESVAGTRRLYCVNRSGLQVVREYLDRFWETTLDNFALLAEAEAEADRSGRSRSTTNRSSAAKWRGGSASIEKK
jgi:DNA-binding transcriptional ArsR family regulator